MGLYINPPDMTKETFLARHGERITPRELVDFDYNGDKLPVCLVDNRAFTAAGICDCKQEFDAFNYGGDPRPKVWFLVERALLKPYMKGYA